MSAQVDGEVHFLNSRALHRITRSVCPESSRSVFKSRASFSLEFDMKSSIRQPADYRLLAERHEVGGCSRSRWVEAILVSLLALGTAVLGGVKLLDPANESLVGAPGSVVVGFIEVIAACLLLSGHRIMGAIIIFVIAIGGIGLKILRPDLPCGCLGGSWHLPASSSLTLSLTTAGVASLVVHMCLRHGGSR